MSFLIPLHRIAVAASLVVFKGVGKRGGITAEREIVACVGSKHYGARHVETVKVTSKRCGGHGYLVVLEVVARGEADVPSVADTDVTTHVERLREGIGLAHLVVVELSASVLPHVDLSLIQISDPTRHLYRSYDVVWL